MNVTYSIITTQGTSMIAAIIVGAAAISLAVVYAANRVIAAMWEIAEQRSQDALGGEQ